MPTSLTPDRYIPRTTKREQHLRVSQYPHESLIVCVPPPCKTKPRNSLRSYLVIQVVRNPRQQNAQRKRFPVVTVLHRQRPGRTPLAPASQQRHRREKHEGRQRHEPVKVCRGYRGAVPDGGPDHESFGEVGSASKQQVGGHRCQKAHPAKVDFWPRGRFDGVGGGDGVRMYW